MIDHTFIVFTWDNRDYYGSYDVAVSYDGGDQFESIGNNSVDGLIKHKLNISRLHSTIYKVTACDTNEPNNCPGDGSLEYDAKSIQITDYIDQIEANYIKPLSNNEFVTEFGTGVALSDNGEILAVASEGSKL